VSPRLLAYFARSVALVAFFSIVDSSASAQDGGVSCGPSEELGPIEVTPSAGASGVRLNSFVRVRYSKDYFLGAGGPTETISLTLDGAAVSGRTELAGNDTLYFIPDAPLVANVQYQGTASGAVFPFDFDFRTGTGNDVANPDLRNPATDDGFVVTSSAVDSDCNLPGSRRIRLEFTSAEDDGPRSSLEYWIYLSRGAGLAAPRLLARVRDYGEAVTTIGAVLGPEEAAEAACISVVVVDGVERSSGWSSPACFDPQTGTGFVGLCAASPIRGRNESGLLGLLGTFGLLGVLVTRRRSRALTRASGT